MCLETIAQESVGAYVSFDEQDGVQPTQSDEQLAWQLHQEQLLERQPRSPGGSSPLAPGRV